MLLRKFTDDTAKSRYGRVEKRVHLIGENLLDVEQFLRTNPSLWGGNTSATRGGHGEAWDLNVGYEGALRLAREGWSEGAKDLSDRLAAHFPERDHVDSWRYDVAGELPDIGRYLAGDPAHMRRHGHPKGHKPIISMLINLCCSGGVSANHYANFGAALVNVIDQLENSGRRVELHVSWISGFGDGRVSCGWTVKQAEDPLDLAAVAFSVAHPAASRRIGFALAERTGVRRNEAYGSVVSVEPEDWPDPTPGMFCIQGIGYIGEMACGTLDAAIKAVTKRINQMAGEELVTVEG